MTELTNEEIAKRIESLEKDQKYQSRTEFVKWIFSVIFFVSLVMLVNYNKKQLKETVYYNKETGTKNAERVDSIVKSIDRNTKRIDYNIKRIDSNKSALDSIVKNRK